MSKGKAVAVIDDALGDQVFRERLSGDGARVIAKRHGITVKQVNAACLTRAPSIDHDTRKTELALELSRIDELYSRFHKVAMDDADDKAASICIRLSERRSSLWGFDNAPLRSMDATITLIQKPPEQLNSTQRIQAVLDALVAQRPARPPVEIEHEPVPDPDPDAQNGRSIS